ncbi:hypothetical protein Kpol_1002p34 [Vanderwaltozyma polyspora DSM 70294]|uniref:ML-like domain-containing protein n=1 Tax=Vanderwaltozyma polyspora (strain ATCC 22028 / DSM 70294 / BCRC 21397 / CBS 2163 / NBRC 10782 / NRRL Y-8283 / UCD 57-17) TaxID=436907 RepID=A7TE65_VANPO|nr:uncharacterized protein Kpol_1002p34 [Vanderwaltozyma polyspora DSM 70294]EDO19387.1 hypothetical protein Kpol_1002p34 [Vanderwaltozyma polyspora DSM 70294]
MIYKTIVHFKYIYIQDLLCFLQKKAFITDTYKGKQVERMKIRRIVAYSLATLDKLSSSNKRLISTSLVPCMENSLITANSFDVSFNGNDNSLHYNVDLVNNIEGYIHANIEIYAYGFKVAEEKLDFCEMKLKQLCPIYQGNPRIEAVQYLPSNYTSRIPNIAYFVPDIDAYAVVKLQNTDNTDVACVKLFFSNGKSVTHLAIQWLTAIITGIGIFLTVYLFLFSNLNTYSSVLAIILSIVQYFQTVLLVSMQSVNRVPPIATAWTENFIWSLGLIPVPCIQKIMRWYIEATGGDPTLNLTATKSSVLTQRGLEFLNKLERRLNNKIYESENTLLFRGVQRVAYKVGIENTSIAATGFLSFLGFGIIIGIFVCFCKLISIFLLKGKKLKPIRFQSIQNNFNDLFKGTILFYLTIGFIPVTILVFWEFMHLDSPALLTIAILLFLLMIGSISISSFRYIRNGRMSKEFFRHPGYIIYGNQHILTRFGSLYCKFKIKYYWWGPIMFAILLIKTIIVAFLQKFGKVQAMLLFITDLLYFVVLIKWRPYLNMLNNVVNLIIYGVITFNSLSFVFFSELFGNTYSVSAIFGWIFFILNSALTFFLMVTILGILIVLMIPKASKIIFQDSMDNRSSYKSFGDEEVDDSFNKEGLKKEGKIETTAELYPVQSYGVNDSNSLNIDIEISHIDFDISSNTVSISTDGHSSNFLELPAIPRRSRRQLWPLHRS